MKFAAGERRSGRSMSGPMPGSSMEKSTAVICLRHYGNLEAAIEGLKAVAGRIALDEPGQLTGVAGGTEVSGALDAGFKEYEEGKRGDAAQGYERPYHIKRPTTSC